MVSREALCGREVRPSFFSLVFLFRPAVVRRGLLRGDEGVFCAQNGADDGLAHRFLSKDVADKYGIDVPPYQGMDQIVEVTGQEEKL